MTLVILIYIGILTLTFWLLLNILFTIGYMMVKGGILGSLCSITFFGVFLVAGAMIFLAMIRPFFRGPEEQFQELVLDRQRESTLFRFVDRLCQVVGSDPPSQILVAPNVNAGASLMNGLFDRRLQLTIGLPLVTGMDTRQFAGVLAHEFGHFTQRSGLRLTYLIRSIDAWLVEAVFARDAWDAKVERLAASENLFVKAVFNLIKGVVWCARMVLLGLLYLSHFFSSRLLHEMEYDADRHEARLAGSDNFPKSMRRFRTLGLCQEKALHDLDHYRRTKRLPDDLAKLLVSNEFIIDKKAMAEFEEAFLNEETQWHETHPSDRDRIDNARRENAPGVFRVEHPASILFSDIDGLSRLVTKEMYRRIFKHEFNPGQMRDTNELVASQTIMAAEGKAALQFVLDQFCGYDSFILKQFELGQPYSAEAFRKAIQFRRDELMKNVRSYAKVCQQEEQIEKELAETSVAIRLLEAGFQLGRHSGMFSVSNLAEAHAQKGNLTASNREIKSRLGQFRQMLGDRILDALNFLRQQEVVESIGEKPQVVQEVEHLLKVWELIIQFRPLFDEFLFEIEVNKILMTVASEFASGQLEKSLLAAANRLNHGLVKIQQSTTSVMYPFQHGQGQVSVSHYLLPDLPDKSDIIACLDASVDLESNLEFLLKRTIARLGALAEKIEKAFGFPPLEVPEEVKTRS